LAMVDCGRKGDYGTVFVQGASAVTPPDAPQGQRGPSPRDAGAVVIPQFTMAVEHYNRIARILKKGLPVRVALELQTTFHDDDLDDYNVLADLPGTDPGLKDQIVMLGGHFDSWHTGTGATDNGCGSAVAMEAMRLIAAYCQQTGVAPKRTIRVALWSGEEQGLLGSRAYVRQQFGEVGALKPEHALLAGYFNLDNGTGKVRGVYLQGNEAVAPIFRAWLRPFHHLGASTLTLDNTGGTDHLAYDAVGLPGFQFIQDPIGYDPKTHHSNMDVWDHVVADDMKQASTVMASFVWHTAQRAEMLPRKAMPAPRQRPAGDGSRPASSGGGR
jgi:carboxypeptidase Q